MEVGGWVQISLGIFFFENKPKTSRPLLIYWSSVQCVFCLYTLLKVVNYYDLSVSQLFDISYQQSHCSMPTGPYY